MRPVLVLLLLITNAAAQTVHTENSVQCTSDITVESYFQKVAELSEDNGALKEKLKQTRLLLEVEKKEGGSWYESPSLCVGLLFGAAAGFTAGYSLLR
jgi:hypothetical protein